MKVKEENQAKFVAAIQNLASAIKAEAEDCGKLCGGLNEKELFVIGFMGNNKNVKMSDIASNIDAPMSTLTNIVDKLVEKKYLVREHSADDRRVINVMLATNGKNAFKAISSKRKSMSEKALSNYQEKAQLAFIDFLNTLASDLRKRE